MNIIKYISSSLDAVNKTFRRFPGTIFFCFLVAGAVIYKTEAGRMLTAYQNDVINRSILSLMLGIPLTLCVSLLIERAGIPAGGRGLILTIIGHITATSLVVFYYFCLLPDLRQTSVVRYLMITAVLYLAALIVPYTVRRVNFEVFSSVLLGRACLTGLYGVVIGLGLTAIVFAIDKLLITSMNTNYYLYIWLTVGTVFAPFFFLAGVPGQQEPIRQTDYPKLLRILLVYVIMPLLSAYTVVLLIYFGQIIALQRWPKGIITFLVLYYAGISTAVLFLALPFKETIKWVRLFCFLLPKLILLPLGMMYAAIGMRVMQYSITESRYYIILLGLWALASMIFLNFPVRRTTILPISLAIVLLLSIFGPWDAFNVSRLGQTSRLYGYLEKNDMIKDGKVIAKPGISDSDKAEISNILLYLEDAHGLRDLKYFPEGFKTQEDMQKVLGFGYSNPPAKNTDNSFFYSMQGTPVADISGYEAMVNVYDYYSYKDGIAGKALEISGFRVVIDGKSNLIKVYDGGKPVYEFDMDTYVDRMYKKYGSNPKGIDTKDFTVEEQSRKLAVKILFRNIGGNYISSAGRYEINTAEMFILLKRR